MRAGFDALAPLLLDNFCRGDGFNCGRSTLARIAISSEQHTSYAATVRRARVGLSPWSFAALCAF